MESRDADDLQTSQTAPRTPHCPEKIADVYPQANLSSPRNQEIIFMRTIVLSLAVVAALLGMAPAASAWEEGSKAAIKKKLESEYKLTKPTDDKSDIVTAGSVVVLQKDKVTMVPVSTAANPCPNNYKDGKLSQNAGCKTGDVIKKIPLFGHTIPGADQAPATRNFVTGEKFWVTKIDVRDAGKQSGIYLELFTDAINEVRYKTSLMIAFKGGMPSPADALKLMQEVLTVQPSEDAKDEKKEPEEKAPAAAAAPPAPVEPPAPVADAAPAPIEPPPPPPEDEKPAPTVALGQTPDEVVAALGQPVKKAKVGTREIYFYKDLKVTFVNNKVKDIQ
jgi:hypothetical protein